MENAALYKRSNELQRCVIAPLLKEYSHLMRWRADGKDSLLDIGCGPGDITIDFVLPLLPLNFTRLVGVDVSEDMLQNARSNYHQRSKVEFRKLDIGVPLDRFDSDQTFDHITSFYCLNWVKNQIQAYKNIYDLLSTEGDCLIHTLAGHPWYDIYEAMSLTSKWQPYMTDVQMYNFPYHNAETASDDLKKVFSKAGFQECQVTLHYSQFVFNGKKELKGAVTLFLTRMPTDVQDEYIDHIASCMPRLDRNDSKILLNYKYLIAYAKK